MTIVHGTYLALSLFQYTKLHSIKVAGISLIPSLISFPIHTLSLSPPFPPSTNPFMYAYRVRRITIQALTYGQVKYHARSKL